MTQSKHIAQPTAQQQPTITWDSRYSGHLNFHNQAEVYFDYQPYEPPERGPEAQYPGCPEQIDINSVVITDLDMDPEDVQVLLDEDRAVELIRAALAIEAELSQGDIDEY